MVFQNYAVFPHLTVFENIAFGLRMQMLEVLAETLIPNEKTESETESKTESTKVKPSKPTPIKADKPAKSAESDKKAGDSSDPMSFFVKKNTA